jgi:hypothetical protein
MIKMAKGKLSCYEALPRETQESFNKFVMYRDLKPHERSITKVAEILEGTQNLKKTRDALNRLCTKWCWVERVKIYDADQQLKLAKKREDTFDGMSDVLLGNIEGLIKYANNLLGEVIERPYKDNGEKYSLVTRIKMTKDVSNLLKEAHELLCNLCGRPSTYSSFEFDGLIDVNAEIVEDIPFEEEMEKYVDFFKQIEQPTESTDNKDSL